MTTVADGHIPLWANSIAKQTDAGAVPGLNSISEAWVNLLRSKLTKGSLVLMERLLENLLRDWAKRSQRRARWEIPIMIDDILIVQLSSDTAATERKT